MYEREWSRPPAWAVVLAVLSVLVVVFFWWRIWAVWIGPTIRSDPRAYGNIAGWLLLAPLWYPFMMIGLFPYEMALWADRVLQAWWLGVPLGLLMDVVSFLAHLMVVFAIPEALNWIHHSIHPPYEPPRQAPEPAHAEPAAPSPAVADAGQAPAALSAEAVGVVEAQRVTMQVDPTAFDGLVGVDAAVEAVKDALELPLLYPEKMKEYALKPPRGVLFYGPPGTGKTSLARATAKYFGCSFFVVNASELVGPLVGTAERSMKRVFQQAKQGRPSVIFFDELDAIGRRRDGSHLNRPSDLLLNLLLAEMDGFDDSAGVFVIGATNRDDVLDEALLRPGRFDRLIEVGLPGHDARVKLFALYLKGRPAAGIDLDMLARRAEGLSPAQIRGICDRAAVAALKRSIAEPSRGGITNEDILRAMAETGG